MAKGACISFIQTEMKETDIIIVPIWVFQLSQLTEIFLYGNKFVTLPQEIGHLGNLETLALSENSLQSLPDTLVNLKRLRVLDLRHNKLNEVSYNWIVMK